MTMLLQCPVCKDLQQDMSIWLFAPRVCHACTDPGGYRAAMQLLGYSLIEGLLHVGSEARGQAQM